MPRSPSAPTVRTISRSEHLDFLRRQRSASFLQTPAWAAVKAEWKAESIGWFRDGRGAPSSTNGAANAAPSSTTGATDGAPSSTNGADELVGAGLVLYRQLPRVKRYLAYLPEGPVIDWADDDLAGWLEPMVAHLKDAGAFGVRMGPPVITARWSAAQVKDGIASDDVRRLTEIAPLERNPAGAAVVSQLHELGWRLQAAEGGFAAGQPQYNFQIPLVDAEGKPRTPDDVMAGMNQLWRRNIRKADKQGVVVEQGTAEGDLKLFHDLYVHTAERDHFTPRPLSYFRTMFEALGQSQDPEGVSDIRLYLARHEGDLVASTIWIRVGAHAWYSYGASSTDKREVRGSNAIQWRMIQDSLEAGAEVYDLRGITDTLDPDDSHVGLIQFKVGTGGEAVEYAGEWDLPIRRTLYKAFEVYLRRRG